ncbi:unnamed protein product [Polarella glacialis]|uniref:HEAT repeat domain-containing protein n=1 Tax=Polarella glacialis TaxID=89957 RepID=A0A813GHQ8_POLGL|nr:unnamed protein product [Polarella glacialis]CAE8739132.1 unnamed protein product [Polarella glacialis]
MIGPDMPPGVGPAEPPAKAKRRKSSRGDAGPQEQAIGPAMGPAAGPSSAPSGGTVSGKVKEHSRGLSVDLPASLTASAGAIRRTGGIGPAPRPAVGSPYIAFTEVHEAPAAKQPVVFASFSGDDKSLDPEKPETPDASAVQLCRRGELPPSGWSAKWSQATKHAVLIAAIDDAQMHVVYALRPQSEVWQQSVQAVELEQDDLNRLLREKASAKPGSTAAKRAKTQEAIRWLLETGASLEALCGDKDFDVRAAASSIVAGLGAEEGGAQAATLLRSEDWQARATAAEALGKLGKEAVIHSEALAKLLGDTETPVRMAATAALGKLGHGAAAHIVEALRSPFAGTRLAACEALGQIGPGAAEHGPAVAELLQDSDWQVPTAAANTLKRFGPAAAAHCALVLSRCESIARPAVAEALVRLGGVHAAESLVPLLRSEDSDVRKHAAECLGSLGSVARPFASALTPLREDSDRDVKREATRALMRLGCGPGLRMAVMEAGDGDPIPPRPEGRGKGGQGEEGKGGGKGGSGKGGKEKGGKGGRETRSRSRGRRSRSPRRAHR